MGNKYRIRLKNDRVVGPFSVSQVGELFVKGHVDGSEDCQVFPVGEWSTLRNQKELAKKISDLISKDATSSSISVDETKNTIAKLAVKKVTKPEEEKDVSSKDGFSEFRFSHDEKSSVNYEQLEKQYQKEKQREDDEDKDIENELGIEPPGVEATRIIKMPSANDVDKTVIVNPQMLKEEVPKDEVEEESEADIEEEVIEEETFDTEEKTEFINLGEVLPDIKAIARDAEAEFERKIEKELNEALEVSDEKTIITEIEEEEESNTKKKMKPIVAIAFIAIIYVLLFSEDDKPKKIIPKAIKIEFPIVAEVEDELKSEKAYQNGVRFYKKGDYVSKLKAAYKFKQSLSNKFKNNKALGRLILTYAELFDNTLRKRQASNTLFRLIEISQGKVLSDINVALGTAIFYKNLKKYQTAITIIENYLRLSTPSLKLFAIYLDVLVDAGDLVKAKPVYQKLKNFKKKSIESYLVMAKYLELEERYDEAKKLLELAGQMHPTSVAILLNYSKHMVRDENFKKYKKILGIIKELQAEQSPIYYSRYLEGLGVLAAVKGKNEISVKYFKKALELNESNELRSKLAALELGGSESVEKLITESKVVDLLRSARLEIRENKWDKAFSLAIEAADLGGNYIPAQLLLAEIQVKRGYYESAIGTLLELKKDYPIHTKINYALVNAYIDSFKLTDARRLVSILSQSKFAETAEYASLMARFFLKKGRIINAENWFKESLKRNPLNDADYFTLAKMYLNFRKYKKSKGKLSKAISLDPLNVTYRTLYAKILYELDSAETAIGYLRNELEKNKDNPKILGDIAVYYFKNGQMTEFNRYKERVEKLATRDPSFYSFLIHAAKLDDRIDDVIINARELIKVNPGDLETRMLLGEYLLHQGKLAAALEMFISIKKRLVAYPRANFYIAKTYIAMGKLDLALKAGQEELKHNQGLSDSHFIVGEVFRLMKNMSAARKNLEVAISRDSKNSEALMSLGWIKYKQNNLEQARELYLRALKVNKNNAEIHKMLGYIYKGVGQASQAIESFQTYLNLAPAAKDRSQIQRMMRLLR